MKKSTLRPTALKVTVVSGDMWIKLETREFNVSNVIRAELNNRMPTWGIASYWIGDNPSCGTLYR